MIEAGATMTEEKLMSADECNNTMMVKYLNLVHGFDVNDFLDGQSQEDMCTQLFKATRLSMDCIFGRNPTTEERRSAISTPQSYQQF